PIQARVEADWFIGDCSFRLARELRSSAEGAEMLGEALQHVNRTLEVGEPRSQQAAAWYERGEILSAMGDCDGAIDSFAQVRYADLSTSSVLTRNAEQRIQTIRFTGSFAAIRGGRCG